MTPVLIAWRRTTKVVWYLNDKFAVIVAIEHIYRHGTTVQLEYDFLADVSDDERASRGI